jgi:uncharacterized YigZ family protein
MERYHIPAREVSGEIYVKNSRFIATIKPVFSVDEAKDFIAQVKDKYSKASHNVPAFIVGHGASVITHCNDDGEPSGTAGRPALAVLQGSGLGDVAVVITRYFGGTKLGTGGLVRAYSDAVNTVLERTPLAERVPTYTVMIVVPYSWFERLRRLIEKCRGQILKEDFAVDVTVTAWFAIEDYQSFQVGLSEASHGSIEAEIIDTGEVIRPVDVSTG